MKVRDVMTKTVIGIGGEESVEVAARQLAYYNVGAMPVYGKDGRLCGMVTDRDLVIRCVAAGKRPEDTKVSQVMTGRVVWADADMDVSEAAGLMGRQQVRRLPVTEKGRLCGVVSLGDLANREAAAMDAAGALGDITSNISLR